MKSLILLILVIILMLSSNSWGKRRSLTEDLEKIEQEEYERKEKEKEEFEREVRFKDSYQREDPAFLNKKPKKNPKR